MPLPTLCVSMSTSLRCANWPKRTPTSRRKPPWASGEWELPNGSTLPYWPAAGAAQRTQDAEDRFKKAQVRFHKCSECIETGASLHGLRATTTAVTALRTTAGNWPVASVNSARTAAEAIRIEAEVAVLKEDERSSHGKTKRDGNRKYDAENDAKLAGHWNAARDQGASKSEFAKAKGYRLTDFNRLLSRVRKRKRGAN